MADAAKNDISEATLRRALVLSGCRKGKERTSDGRWFWRLPTPLTLPVYTSRPELRPETLDFNVAGGELWSSWQSWQSSTPRKPYKKGNLINFTNFGNFFWTLMRRENEDFEPNEGGEEDPD